MMLNAITDVVFDTILSFSTQPAQQPENLPVHLNPFLSLGKLRSRMIHCKLLCLWLLFSKGGLSV